jgi:hypothetical protein
MLARFLPAYPVKRNLGGVFPDPAAESNGVQLRSAYGAEIMPLKSPILEDNGESLFQITMGKSIYSDSSTIPWGEIPRPGGIREN